MRDNANYMTAYAPSTLAADICVDVADMLRAFAARLDAEAKETWQPMETYQPGTSVLVYYRNSLGNPRIAHATFYEPGTIYMTDGTDESFVDDDGMNREGFWAEEVWGEIDTLPMLENDPLLWQPLPSAPKEETR